MVLFFYVLKLNNNKNHTIYYYQAPHINNNSYICKKFGTMNIDELSLYDWVLYNGKPHRVEAMNRPAQMVGLCSPHFAATTDAKNIEPMPITEDMLLRSGFEHDGTCEYILEQKTSEREGKKHFWIKVVPPQPDNDDWWSPDQTGFEVNNDICDMLLEGIGNVYVHQLQHVLQLAGINFYDVIKIKEN